VAAPARPGRGLVLVAFARPSTAWSSTPGLARWSRRLNSYCWKRHVTLRGHRVRDLPGRVLAPPPCKMIAPADDTAPPRQSPSASPTPGGSTAAPRTAGAADVSGARVRVRSGPWPWVVGANLGADGGMGPLLGWDPKENLAFIAGWPTRLPARPPTPSVKRATAHIAVMAVATIDGQPVVVNLVVPALHSYAGLNEMI